MTKPTTPTPIPFKVHHSSKTGIVRPPAPTEGMDMRTWLAGCALANASLVLCTDPPEQVAKQALAIADRIMESLKTQPTPSEKSMKAPTERQMKKWDERTGERAKQTIPAGPATKRKTIHPPPMPEPEIEPVPVTAKEAFQRATKELRKASEQSLKAVTEKPRQTTDPPKPMGFYSFVADEKK